MAGSSYAEQINSIVFKNKGFFLFLAVYSLAEIEPDSWSSRKGAKLSNMSNLWLLGFFWFLWYSCFIKCKDQKNHPHLTNHSSVNFAPLRIAFCYHKMVFFHKPNCSTFADQIPLKIKPNPMVRFQLIPGHDSNLRTYIESTTSAFKESGSEQEHIVNID